MTVRDSVSDAGYRRLSRRTAALVRADMVKFLTKPKTKQQIVFRFCGKLYGRGEDRTRLGWRLIERQLLAAIAARLVMREGGKKYARYVVTSSGAPRAARVEAALETRRENAEARWERHIGVARPLKARVVLTFCKMKKVRS